MLDHMIFNAKKWFEISNDMSAITANNKNYYACPSRFTVMAETPIKNPNTGNGWRVLNDAEVTCVGAGKDVYFFDGQLEIYADSDANKHPYNANYSYYYYTGVVEKTNVRNVIWGAKPFYLLLYQWLRMLSLHLRKERKYARSYYFKSLEMVEC